MSENQTPVGVTETVVVDPNANPAQDEHGVEHPVTQDAPTPQPKPYDLPPQRGYINEAGDMVFPEADEKPKGDEKPATGEQPKPDDKKPEGEQPPATEKPATETTEIPTNVVPLIQKVGEKEFDLSVPEQLSQYQEALREEGRSAAEAEKEAIRQTQTNEEAWQAHLKNDKYLEGLGVTNPALIEQQVTSGMADQYIAQMTQNVNALYSKYDIANDGATEEQLTEYNKAKGTLDAYTMATSYVKNLIPLRQANELIADKISEDNKKVDSFWRTFAPLSGITVEEWFKGDKSENYKVRDVVRDVVNNPANWKTYNYYGQQKSVLINPNAIREAYEARFGAIPVAPKTGVSATAATAAQPVHSAPPKSTVVTPAGSNLTIADVRAGIEDPAKFASFDSDESRDKVALQDLAWQKESTEKLGVQPKLHLHIRRWVEERGLKI